MSPEGYYGRPLLKAPVWTWEVPWYFFAGGLAGASAPLALAAGITGRERLARRAWGVALAGAAASPALLVSDLGRPERFANMLRLVKPTSPMSLGSWQLAGFGPCAGLAATRGLGGRLPRAARAGRVGAAALGPGLATYTAALLAGTAVPAWHEGRRELPWVFAGSALAAAGGAGALLAPAAESAPARRAALLGAAAETVAMERLLRRLGARSRAYRDGRAGAYGRAARWLTGAGAALSAGGGDRPGARRAGAVALLAGSALTRWNVFQAGRQSALEPAGVRVGEPHAHP